MPKVMVLAGTTDGLFVAESDGKRRQWRRRGPYLRGASVSHFAWDAKAKTIYAATFDDGVYASKTMGRTWSPLNKGLAVRKVWTVAVHPKDSDQLWAGTHFSYLFHSTDRGRTWGVVGGYLNAPGKEGRYGDWSMGTGGNAIHGLHIDPQDPRRMYVVSSTDHGAVRTDDGGESWAFIRKGVIESCPLAAISELGKPPKSPQEAQTHLDQVHACTHRLGLVPGQPNILYRQQHCGVYRSDDHGETWQDISAGLPERHGFPLAVHPRDAQTAFIVPAYQGTKCTKHNSCIVGQLEVYRTRAGGRSWEALRHGLPGEVHTVVLRHGMDADRLRPAGVYVGTSTGELYASANEGDEWRMIASKLPRIQGVVAVVA